MRNKSYDDLIDSFIWKNVKPTYEQVHLLGLTDQERCRKYVLARWSPEVGPRGITIRTNKLWDRVRGSLRVLPSDNIEGSLWRVTYHVMAAVSLGEIEGVTGQGLPIYRTLECYESYSSLGWVIADNENGAKMIARVILGPRAHSQSVRVTREGVSTWERVKAMNAKHATDLRKIVEQAKNSLRLKTLEIENLECQVSFLETGATFEIAE